MGEIMRGFIMPHPPIIVPEIGAEKQKEAKKTVDACIKAAKIISSIKPDTIIVTTPHGTIFQDYIYMPKARILRGSFAQFGHSEVSLEFQNDIELGMGISEEAGLEGIPAGDIDSSIKEKYNISDRLDHGVLVPLYFVYMKYTNFKLVQISISSMSNLELYKFGTSIRKAVEKHKRRVVFIASGDLSHKLKEDGPYGFAKEGVDFDAEFIKSLEGVNIAKLVNLDRSFCEAAGECGLRSFLMLFGAFDGYTVKVNVYSYEGPFGVGYAVAEIEKGAKGSTLLGIIEKERKKKIENIRSNEDVYVGLARKTVEEFVKNRSIISVPKNLPEEMLKKRAGTFVSIKKDGELRGCIGTISATRENIAEEIIQNAISACSKDPRFSPIREEELERLTYSVDILKEAEPINSLNELDVKRYGVIVTSGFKRGLLLPNLEGVDTPEKQVEIALRKADIRPDEDYEIERFEVIRHK